MNLEALQNEINMLMYLYFTAIGVIQRDVDSEDIENIMKSLVEEIKGCKLSLDRILSETNHPIIQENKNKESIIEEAKIFISDGLFFIDKITN